MDDQDPGGISTLQQMVASGAGAVVTSLFMTPLDVVKVRLQSQRPSGASELTTPSSFWSLSYTKSPSALQAPGKCLLYSNGVLEPLYLCPNGIRCATWFQDPTRFTGTLDAFVKIVRHEGTRTLWSGLPATLVMTMPATAIYFTAYDQLKAFLCGQSLTSDLYAPMVAGALARMGTVTVVSPLELVRTKLQAQHVSYRELATCVLAAVVQGGWRSLWLGWGPTALRDVPFSALYWFNYELVKSWLNGLRPKDQTTVGVSFVAGGISGMVAATLTQPFDVVKTQRQMSVGAVEAVRVKPPRVDSTWLPLRRIQAESGTRGLFAGFLPRIIKAAPSCAIMISTNESGKSFSGGSTRSSLWATESSGATSSCMGGNRRLGQVPSLPIQSHRLSPYLDSCCSPSQDCHSPTSEFKTKSDDCPSLCPPYVCYSLARGAKGPGQAVFPVLFVPCLKTMIFCAK